MPNAAVGLQKLVSLNDHLYGQAHSLPLFMYA
jgi:hypothetical protein